MQSIKRNLARIDTATVVVLSSIIGLALMFYGLFIEQEGQMQLLKDGGLTSLESYRAFLNLKNFQPVEYLTLAMQGALPSFGGNSLGVGFVLMFSLPLATFATLSIAKAASNIEEE